MWVKICANTTLEDALLATELGADAVGFVFAPSQRQVTPEQVASITPHLPMEVLRIGVFGSSDSGEILRAAEIAGLDGAQLHRAYDPQLVKALRVGSGGRLAVVQVVSVDVDAEYQSAEVEGELSRRLEAPFANAELRAVLLDAAKAGVSGGLGRTFPWEAVGRILAEVLKRARTQHEAAGTTMPTVILAGGLRAEDVAEAIALFQPSGVDVASGVEASPGRKSPERLAAFLTAARGGPQPV